jgi:hypothetical protein
MVLSSNIRQRAKDLVDQLPDSSLQQAITLLESLQPPVAAPQPSPEAETDLLAIIQWRLPPEEQTRLAYLRQRSETDSLSPAEHQELLVYSDRLEQHDAERAAALIQLAQLRQLPLEQLLTKFLPAHVA